MSAAKDATPMQVLVKGRIEAARRHNEARYTRIATPAPDPYSRPQIIEVRSKAPIGQKGDEVAITGKLGGYVGKPFRFTDKETGEIIQGQSVTMTLDLVE